MTYNPPNKSFTNLPHLPLIRVINFSQEAQIRWNSDYERTLHPPPPSALLSLPTQLFPTPLLIFLISLES